MQGSYNYWRQGSNISLPSISPAGLDRVELPHRFNDLDLLIMGAKSWQQCYTASSNQFYWFEPKFVTPLPYHAGLCVVFSPQDYFYFGFHMDHRVLGVQQTGQSVIRFDLQRSGYTPFARSLVFTPDVVDLRIVRRGDEYHFQVKLESQDELPSFTRPPSHSLLENIDPLPVTPVVEGTSLEQFRTISILQHSGSPQAIGLILKTWAPIFCNVSFYNLELLDGTNRRLIYTNKIPSRWNDTTNYTSIPLDSFVFHRPSEAATAITDGGFLHLITRYAGINDGGRSILFGDCDHWTSVDRAPKFLTRSPNGDFTMATYLRINGSYFSQRTGGAASGASMWGRVHGAYSKDVSLSQRSIDKQPIHVRYPKEPIDTYKLAFIILAQTQSQIPNSSIERIDIIRRYFDAMFEAATFGIRHINSIL